MTIEQAQRVAHLVKIREELQSYLVYVDKERMSFKLSMFLTGSLWLQDMVVNLQELEITEKELQEFLTKKIKTKLVEIETELAQA